MMTKPKFHIKCPRCEAIFTRKVDRVAYRCSKCNFRIAEAKPTDWFFFGS
jgi:DNA-directed RNA polymerase subunit RPC12/RpoP